MAVIICQSCGAEFASWAGNCPKCSGTQILKVSTTSTDKLIGRTVKGGFKVLQKLGQGGMGAVYLAEREGLGQKIALKFLNANLLTDTDIARRFLNEAKTYARIAHPNAVTLHGFEQEEDGSLFIAMEFVEGADLKKVIADRKRLPPPEAVEIALQVADVLQNAHGKGIIHRDLKPENVMVRSGMRGIFVKVLDFGIARLLEDGATRLTAQGLIAGTPRYMAPEQVEGKDVDARADIYALGVVLFEMLSGVQPFDGSTVAEILRNQVVKPMPHLHDVSVELDWPALDAVIQKACAKNRVERYPTMAAFAQDLSNAMPTMAGFAAMKVNTQSATTGSNAVYTPPPVADEPATQLDSVGGAHTFMRAPPPVAEPKQDPFSKTAYPSAPAPKKSSAGLVAAVAGVVIVAGLGLAVYLGNKRSPAELPAQPQVEAPPKIAEVKTPEVKAPEVKPDLVVAPPQGNDEMRARLMWKEILLKARAEFFAGQLDSALQIAQLEGEPDPAIAPELKQLVTDIQDAQKRLGQGRALAAKGDCAAAIKVFDGVLAKYPSVKDARSGRDSCRKMLPPSIAE